MVLACIGSHLRWSRNSSSGLGCPYHSEARMNGNGDMEDEKPAPPSPFGFLLSFGWNFSHCSRSKRRSIASRDSSRFLACSSFQSGASNSSHSGGSAAIGYPPGQNVALQKDVVE